MAEKQDLLHLLEKDIPTLHFCHDCVNWSRSIAPWYEEDMPCRSDLDKHLFLPSSGYIPYYYARVLVNRHFFGSTHGPPVQKLDERARSWCHSDGVVISETQHARIVDDSLLVLSAVFAVA